MDEMQAPTTPAGSNSGAVGITWMVNEIDGTKLVRHGGSTNGQMSAFLFAPQQGFAITVLTNANRGGELHGTTVDWALKEYLGLVAPVPPLLERSAEQLAEYAGRYHAALSDIDLSVEVDTLVLQATPRSGFPMRDSEPGEPPPPTRLSLREDERVIGLDAPYKGSRGKFLRDASGAIEWLRFGGRIAKRER